jgi:hypothetical protein
MKILRAIAQGIKRLALGAIKSPIDVLFGLLGIGGQSGREHEPAFRAPGNTSELLAELTNGHQVKAAAPSRESEAVTAIFKMRNGRSAVNLSSVDKRDVQDLLIGMSPTQIEDLCRAGRPAILKLLRTGDSGVFGVPMTNVARLRHAREEMAKPKGSKPYTMPAM